MYTEHIVYLVYVEYDGYVQYTINVVYLLYVEYDVYAHCAFTCRIHSIFRVWWLCTVHYKCSIPSICVEYDGYVHCTCRILSICWVWLVCTLYMYMKNT